MKSTSSNSAPSSSSKQVSSGSASETWEVDPALYGLHELSNVCEHYIVRLFGCSPNVTDARTHATENKRDSIPTPPNSNPSSPIINDNPLKTNHAQTQPYSPGLAQFIAWVIHRTRLPLQDVHGALLLLYRLRLAHPGVRASSGHRLVLAALMIAQKVNEDSNYSAKSWSIAARIFSVPECNALERELLHYLSWNVNMNPFDLDHFATTVLDQCWNQRYTRVQESLKSVPWWRPTHPLPRYRDERESSCSGPSALRSEDASRLPPTPPDSRNEKASK